MIRKVKPYIFPMQSDRLQGHQLYFLLVTHEKRTWWGGKQRFGDMFVLESVAQEALKKLESC